MSLPKRKCLAVPPVAFEAELKRRFQQLISDQLRTLLTPSHWPG